MKKLLILLLTVITSLIGMPLLYAYDHSPYEHYHRYHRHPYHRFHRDYDTNYLYCGICNLEHPAGHPHFQYRSSYPTFVGMEKPPMTKQH